MLRAEGKYEDAVEIFTRILRNEPHHLEALFNRAYCYDMLAKYDLSEADYSEVILLNPGLQPAYLNRGQARYAQQKWDSAIVDLNFVLRFNQF